MSLTSDEIKQKVGRAAADLVQPGMRIGLGTGSTVYWLIEELGLKIKQGLKITAVPTSSETERLAKAAGIPLSDLDAIDLLDLDIDGADEIDPSGQLIKGGGGALLQEKIVAHASRELIVIADASKLVSQLGVMALPIEVIPFGEKQVTEHILQYSNCRKVTLRQKGGHPFLSDHGHHILDCHYDKIADAKWLNDFLHAVPGVVETGLFLGMASSSLIGFADGRIESYQYKTGRE